MVRVATISIVVAIVFGCVAVLYLNQILQRALLLDSEQSLIVESGDHLSGLGTELKAKGWLPVPQVVFSAYARLTDSRGHIRKGEYLLEPGITVPGLIEKLRSGDVVQRTLTFPEGWTTAQWIDLLASNEFIVSANLDAVQADFGSLEKLEGRLFPDTYAYTRGESASSILRRAKLKMDQVLEEVWQERSEAVAVDTAEELLILASIIEKETGYAGDRGLISSVFSNRLNIDMKLQSDPTVIYGLSDFDGDLKRSHLSEPHDFNTYVIPALPIGPICNPGRLSLQAAAHPEASPYFYFVAKGDGRSQFSVTLAEHNRAVVQFQKAGRVEYYRSAPPGNR